MKKFFFSSFLIFLNLNLTLGLATSCINPQEMGDPKKVVMAMANSIERQFPSAPQLSIEEYQRKLKENPKGLILVDVRSEEEMAISKIEGAITRKEFEDQREKYKDKLVVSYCTIGQRSSEYTVELRKIGFQAFNLKESILGWTHHSLPLTDPKGERTKKVHVYGEAWNLAAKDYKAIWKD